MSLTRHEIESYYSELFIEDPLWSANFPNPDEAARWAKISICLSHIAKARIRCSGERLRILDVGCGRGWMTRLAGVYGDCEGIDNVPEVIESAQRAFPGTNFFLGTVSALKRAPGFKPYDVLIASEVIEHVEDKEPFVEDLADCLHPGGHAVITTPRGEVFQKWLRLNHKRQPVEAWISEKELSLLFERHGFHPLSHDRVYLDLPAMSFLNRFCAARRISKSLNALGLTWLLKGLCYAAAIYQLWHFQLRKG